MHNYWINIYIAIIAYGYNAFLVEPFLWLVDICRTATSVWRFIIGPLYIPFRKWREHFCRQRKIFVKLFIISAFIARNLSVYLEDLRVRIRIPWFMSCGILFSRLVNRSFRARLRLPGMTSDSSWKHHLTRHAPWILLIPQDMHHDFS